MDATREAIKASPPHTGKNKNSNKEVHQPMQYVIVIAVLALAIAYAAVRAYKALTNKNGKCHGCPLKEACGKKAEGSTKGKAYKNE